LSLPSSLLRPDPPVSPTPTDFPGALVLPQVCARRPGLGCRRALPCCATTLLPCVPSPLRREEAQRHPRDIPAPRGLPQQNNASAPPATQHQLPLGMCLRRGSVRLMLRPAEWLALLDWSDLGFSSGRRGRLPPSLPEVGHPHPESGMTTPPFWGRTMTGLAPAGALPLQAARIIANTSMSGRGCAIIRLHRWRGLWLTWGCQASNAPPRTQPFIASGSLSCNPYTKTE